METKLAFKSREGKDAVLKRYDSFRQGWPQPNQEYGVPTRYGETFVIECGDKTAPPLILLHGSSMNSLMWMGDAREYCRKYRVFAVDIPGEPGRSEERQLPFHGPAFADWLSDVFQALSLPTASLVGISLGAWLALKFAVAYPEKVDRLVLLCPAGVGP